MDGCAGEQDEAVNQEDEETINEGTAKQTGSGKSNDRQGVDESSKVAAVDGGEATPSAGSSEEPYY